MTEKNSKGRISKSSPVIYKGELISKEQHGVTSKIALDLLKIQKNEMSLDALVHFKCKNLEKILRWVFQIPYRPITRRDLAGTTEWDLNGWEITDLSGLECMTQMTQICIYETQISDITPLQGMTQMTELWLPDNQISDITPLQGMTQLTELFLFENQISDITPLQSMTQLTRLDLSHNHISDSQKEMLRKALPDCDISF